MAKTTLIFAALLIALGVGSYAYALSNDEIKDSPTALIPAFAGVLLGVCGVLALKESRRKHAMHAAAAVGLLCFLAAAGRVAPKLISDGFPDDPGKQLATVGSLGMAALCLIFVILCVRSFVLARTSVKPV